MIPYETADEKWSGNHIFCSNRCQTAKYRLCNKPSSVDVPHTKFDDRYEILADEKWRGNHFLQIGMKGQNIRHGDLAFYETHHVP